MISNTTSCQHDGRDWIILHDGIAGWQVPESELQYPEEDSLRLLATQAKLLQTSHAISIPATMLIRPGRDEGREYDHEKAVQYRDMLLQGVTTCTPISLVIPDLNN